MHKVWLADDDEAIRIVLEESLRDAGFDIRTFETATDLIENLANEKPDLILTDVQMPGMHGYDLLKHINNNFSDLPVIIMTAFADMQAAIDSYGSGAFEYIPKPFDLNETIQIIRRALEKKPSTKGLKSAPKTDIIGKAQSMQIVFRAIGKLSNTNATVLVQGESGTGKELIAKSLHKNSPRHDMPFIALNMADIPKELVESELFGHEKGAFTGAVDRRLGRFEQANGGTLFLDEIGDMPLDSQTRLLRVLSNKEFYRVGGDKPIKVDVRIIAATHQNLHNLVSQTKFREDLFYRLNVIKVDVPPLRERMDDIEILAKYFLKQNSDSLGEELRVLSKESIEVLRKYKWPGNVRQLENTCYWLTLMSPTQNVQPVDLPNEIIQAEPYENTITSSWEDGFSLWLKNLIENNESGLLDTINPKIEKMLIKLVLEKTNGKKNDAANILGLGRNTLAKKIKELGI
ncbi:nitrogen regulation protein NR(I) [Gammaproteobacteria bacterium]|nr:nitrogen regulation protein NR(I) [Gammaproteobacteria bacterium]MDA8981877.1 nitrogen regulation protein NR(I) [Gammaproteobacteria bacterium]MDA9143051.1 nitrogen regulation protein NR(I) [Gammaproteobacteria bacterium]MDA9997168.1 nitrogen regulation protein NR(I) [Gammaproteobacteria bacterium]MDC0367350.1 nitrogen regulation protein NR(I) [Gammaproteobacteria bacterium]